MKFMVIRLTNFCYPQHNASLKFCFFSYLYYSCSISSWFYSNTTSCPHATPWNVTTPTPWDDATTTWCSTSSWSSAISYATPWSNATPRGYATTSWYAPTRGTPRTDARTTARRQSTTANCWKILIVTTLWKKIRFINSIVLMVGEFSSLG